MSLPVAIQLYSVRDDAAADFRGSLEKIKKMGYDGVEFAGLYGNSPAQIRSMCKEIGLVPISAHVPYYDMVADPEGVCGNRVPLCGDSVSDPGMQTRYGRLCRCCGKRTDARQGCKKVGDAVALP